MANGSLPPGFNLQTLLKRLEAATSRLEDIAVATTPHAVLDSAPVASSAGAAANGGAKDSAPALTVSSPAAAATSLTLSAYQGLIDGALAAYVTASEAIGDVVAQQVRVIWLYISYNQWLMMRAREQANLVKQAFLAQHDFLRAAQACKKPSSMQDPALLALLKDTQTALESAQNVKETDRARKFQAHLSVVNEGIPALGWVMVVRLLFSIGECAFVDIS